MYLRHLGLLLLMKLNLLHENLVNRHKLLTLLIKCVASLPDPVSIRCIQMIVYVFH